MVHAETQRIFASAQAGFAPNQFCHLEPTKWVRDLILMQAAHNLADYEISHPLRGFGMTGSGKVWVRNDRIGESVGFEMTRAGGGFEMSSWLW
jgi:hypothetical protein